MDNTRSGNLELHPVENPVVLGLIFECCSVDALKNCRLVSRLWREASRIVWQSLAIATIIGPDEDEDGRTMSDLRLFSRNYENQQGQILEVPFTNFCLRSEDSLWLYSVWGSNIRVLNLEDMTFESGTVFLKMVFSWCQNLEDLFLATVTVQPISNDDADAVAETGTAHQAIEQINWTGFQEHKNLKLLNLHGFTWESVSVVWMEFLKRVPSLQDLTLSLDIGGCKELIQSLKTIREEDPNKLKLKRMDLRFLEDLSPAILPILLDTKLELEKLEFGPGLNFELSKRLPEILNRHASSLKNLGLAIESYSVSHVSQFSRQKQLLNLQALEIFQFGRKEFPLNEFLMLMPILKKMSLFIESNIYLRVEDHDVSATPDNKLNICTELELSVKGLTTHDMDHFTKLTPNLKKLRIHGLSNEMFWMVCDGWPNLVRLDVRDSTVDDSGITGLDAADVEEINRNGERGVWKPITVPRANITHLKELQRFTIRGHIFVNPGAPALGLCASICGFELLPNLRHLTIPNLGGPCPDFWEKFCARYPWQWD